MTDRKIPRDRADDYADGIIQARQEFAREHTGSPLEHVASYSLDPATLPGNVEGFLGVAQVPIGLAGPVLVNGEHAQGEFLVPLATTEGTLVASYSRGMKFVPGRGRHHDHGHRRPHAARARVLLRRRAPGAGLRGVADRALRRRRGGRADDHQAPAGSSTSSSSRSPSLLYTRFNYTTGDAAGQNMTGKATFAACAWIKQNYPGEVHFLLEGQFATDKKTSIVNMLHTRGKRVVAEITLPAALVEEQMHVSTDKSVRRPHARPTRRDHVGDQQQRQPLRQRHHRDVHRHRPGRRERRGEPPPSTASPSSLANGDFYASVTLPSLIVATYGGGTGLATQRECLGSLGCYGAGNVYKAR
ncbi:hypothetical protein [Nocardioides convexus]|uniref:hypothetical protein n=1 Tax=Nocardioides convexus TaxID=2712224 RepID=UPI00241874F5|nr:hypothetical protein [Nocardioides convexus]